MEKTSTWYKHKDHVELTETSNNWALAVPEVLNDYCANRHPALKHSPIPTSIIRNLRKKFKKTRSVSIIVFVSCWKFFPSVRYLFSQFLRAGIVPQKGHKFSAYSLKLAQPFLNAVFLLSRTGKASNSHLEKLFSWQI